MHRNLFWTLLLAMVLTLGLSVTALASGCGDDDDDDNDDDEDCFACQTTSECTDALGTGWVCNHGCCEEVGDDDDDDDDDTGDDDDDTGEAGDIVFGDDVIVNRAAPGSRQTSILADGNGNLHLAFTGCSDASCLNSELFYGFKASGGDWIAMSLDAAGNDTGWFPSITLDSMGGVHIVYGRHDNHKLKYATLPPGGAWSVQEIGQGYGGFWTASSMSGDVLHVTHTEFPNASSLEGTAGHAMLVGGSWSYDTIDSTYDCGWFTSLASDNMGLPVAGYNSGYIGGTFTVARLLAKGWEIGSVDTGVISNDVAVDSSGTVHAVYAKIDSGDVWDLMYANDSSGLFVPEVLFGGDTPEYDTGGMPHIQVDDYDGLHVSYRDFTLNHLRYARNLGDGWEFESGGSGGQYSSLDIDPSGNVHIAFEESGQIKHVVCEGCALH